MVKVSSMFAGIGGICTGFKQAGCDIVWANEIDQSACNTYRHNFGNSYLVEGDIKKIDVKSIPDFDILTAGFPCQPFSLVGRKKGFNDDRGALFFEIERIVEASRPRVIFLENVANLTEHNEVKSFLTVFNSLAQFGYVVRYKTLSPKDYVNIPQQRNRVFIIAFKNLEDSLKFNYPDKVPLEKKVINLINIHEKHNECYYYENNHYLYNSLNAVVKQKGKIYKIEDSRINPIAYSICPTLTANMGTFKDRVPVIKDDFGIRKITPQECLKLQGFPDNFTFPKGTSFDQAYKQIGNSVCVPIITKLATSIKNIIDC